MGNELQEQEKYFDLGHQGDLDYTQIRRMLAMTPDQRLDRLESWRVFVKEAIARAALRSGGDQAASDNDSAQTS
jgi:hypothetical protein